MAMFHGNMEELLEANTTASPPLGTILDQILIFSVKFGAFATYK
jgi:hypothetical protein